MFTLLSFFILNLLASRVTVPNYVRLDLSSPQYNRKIAEVLTRSEPADPSSMKWYVRILSPGSHQGQIKIVKSTSFVPIETVGIERFVAEANARGWPVGSKVRIDGLLNPNYMQLNGREARVLTPIQNQRQKVKIDGQTDTHQIKPEKMKFVSMNLQSAEYSRPTNSRDPFDEFFGQHTSTPMDEIFGQPFPFSRHNSRDIFDSFLPRHRASNPRNPFNVQRQSRDFDEILRQMRENIDRMAPTFQGSASSSQAPSAFQTPDPSPLAEIEMSDIINPTDLMWNCWSEDIPEEGKIILVLPRSDRITTEALQSTSGSNADGNFFAFSQEEVAGFIRTLIRVNPYNRQDPLPQTAEGYWKRKLIRSDEPDVTPAQESSSSAGDETSPAQQEANRLRKIEEDKQEKEKEESISKMLAKDEELRTIIDQIGHGKQKLSEKKDELNRKKEELNEEINNLTEEMEGLEEVLFVAEGERKEIQEKLELALKGGLEVE